MDHSLWVRHFFGIISFKNILKTGEISGFSLSFVCLILLQQHHWQALNHMTIKVAKRQTLTLNFFCDFFQSH